MRAKSFLLSLILGCLSALNLSSMAQVKPRENAPPQKPQTKQTPGEAGKYSGPGSCASSNCHGGVQPKGLVRIAQNEYSIWAAQDKHSRAYTVLSNPTSIRIGKILGLEQAPNKSEKCLVCHALNVRSDQRAQTFQSIDDGVSCESCHGPAVGWLGQHTLKNWTHEQSLKLGMYDTRDLAKRTDRCLTCHLGTPEKEVDHIMIAAGHPDLTFELESFSSVMPRHWRPAQGANPWLSVQELAIGQAVQLREALHRLDRRASGPNWPEYSEYECFACHHSLTKPEASWRQAQGYDGRLPGLPSGTRQDTRSSGISRKQSTRLPQSNWLPRWTRSRRCRGSRALEIRSRPRQKARRNWRTGLRKRSRLNLTIRGSRCGCSNPSRVMRI